MSQSPDLTEQQRRAIGARGVSVALSAGAGCGKTFVLTERFLACLEPGPAQGATAGSPSSAELTSARAGATAGLPSSAELAAARHTAGQAGSGTLLTAEPRAAPRLDQLTAITFTERAARQMRERIRAACTRRLLDAPEAQVEHWLRTLRELESARISTIHAFCGGLLRAHAVEARLDPQFRVLDQAETETLLYELIDQELRDRLARRDEAVLELVVQFGLAGPSGLAEMVRRLLAARQEIDWERWRSETADGLTARWEAFWRSDALPRIVAQVSALPAVGQLLAAVRDGLPSHPVMRQRCELLAERLGGLVPPSPSVDTLGATAGLSSSAESTVGQANRGTRELLAERLGGLAQAGDPAATLAEIREAARVQGGGGKKAWPSPSAYENFRDAAERLRKEIDRVAGQAAFDPQAARPAAQLALGLLRVADAAAAAFQQEKEQLAALDFDDLLVRARDLLVGPAGETVRRRLAAQTRLLMVDEFQDTDPLQVELVKLLCDGRYTDGKLFFVGDHKQSIYRFRGADPHVFRRLREEIPPAGQLPLSLNFRSQPAVLDFVNALFAEELGPSYEPLRPYRPQVGPTPAVEFLWAIEPDDDGPADPGGDDGAQAGAAGDGPGDGPAAEPAPEGGAARESPTERRRKREADYIARRIRGMLDRGEKLVWDKEAEGGRRKAEGGGEKAGEVAAGGPAAVSPRPLPPSPSTPNPLIPSSPHPPSPSTPQPLNPSTPQPPSPSTPQPLIPSSPHPLRAVRPGDVTILFRALTNVELYEEALRRYDIEYYLVGGHAFYAQQEIYDVVNLLRTLASPGDEASLAGVLRSPMFGLLDETLFQLVQRHGSLSAGLFAKDRPKSFRTPEGDSPIFAGRKLGQSPGSSPADPNQGPAPEADGEPIDEEQSARVRFAAATIAELRAIKDRVPIAELLGAALARTGYDAVLLAEFLGPRKLANLQKLVEQARSFDASGIFTLADFITQLAQFIARQPDEPLAATQPESIHAVRLMTIHQAKGLEFPVVIVADLDRPRRKVGPAAAFTPRLGPVVRLPEVTSGYDLFMAAEAEEESAELKRLLYVATTRAADYLILSAGLAAGGTPRGPWMELLARRFDLQSGAMIPVGGAAAPSPPALLAAEERRLATVATSEPPLGTVPKAKASRPDLSKLVAEAREAAARHLGQVPKELAPVAPDPLARRQYSFSRLSGVLHARGGPLVTAATDDDAEPAAALDPLGLGTLVHAVLAELAERGQTAPGKGTVPFSSDENRDSPPAASADDIAALVRRHAARHLPDVGGSAPSPSEETGNPQVAPDGLEEPIDLVRRLLASKRWSAVAGAAEVYTELEFLLPWPPGNADPRAPYLRGYIDCLYRDTAGDWHLLDYKTNRVAADGVAVVAAEYEMQMLVYALAVERILGAGPRELVLCFLRPGVEFLFAWDAAARARAIELVNQAIRRAMSN